MWTREENAERFFVSEDYLGRRLISSLLTGLNLFPTSEDQVKYIQEYFTVDKIMT